MEKIYIFLILATFASLSQSLIYTYDPAKPPDYCLYQTNLCRYQGLVHYACNKNGSWHASCPSYKEVEVMTPERIQILLDLHNKWRSEVALGKMVGLNNKTLPQATRMATVSWSQELADLALLNAKQCKMQHDSCHNTAEFLYSGQNLGISKSNRQFSATENAINFLTMAWFNQYKSANGSNTDKCCFTYTGADIGHFLTFVIDRSTHIGCAMTKFKVDGWRIQVLACNYASAAIAGYRLYKSGPVGSECKSGMNPAYPGLCSINEKIDANKFY